MADKKPTLSDRVEALEIALKEQQTAPATVEPSGIVKTDSGMYRKGFIVTLVECANCKQLIENHTKMFCFEDKDIESFVGMIHTAYIAQQNIICANPVLTAYLGAVLVNEAYVISLQNQIQEATPAQQNALSNGELKKVA